MAKLTASDKALLKDICESTATEGVGMLLIATGDKMLAKLVKAGLAELNPSGEVDADGNIAVRATEAGMTEAGVTPAASVAPENTSDYEIETGVVIPKVRRVGKGTKYPFDSMAEPVEVNGKMQYSSFHVPATEDKPTPAKGLASVVSAAKKRYKEATGETEANEAGVQVPVMALTRNFVVRRADATDPKGVGARVFRVELPVD